MTAGALGMPARSSRFKRYVLPGLAFKAVVIGGGYATGREIAEFFLPAGPWGGLAAMALSTLIWSVVCVATFLFARKTGAKDYRAFFKGLLGRGWIVFEIAYGLFVVLILSVFGAAAGAIAAATLGTPPILGTLALMAGIAGFAAFGNSAVERLFAWVSILLYGVYALFLVLALTSFGDRIVSAFGHAPPLGNGWAAGGITYAGYNIVGAVIILPVTRHLTSDRDAFIAGAIAGPLAMLPAILFFTCMTAFMPDIANAVLPSDYMLVRLGQPIFHLVFQLMIFAALLESGTGAVHAINQRVASVWERGRGVAPGPLARGSTALALLMVCMLLAERIGLVALIASGYRILAYAMIAIYVVPLLTFGLWRLRRHQDARMELA
ncbi:YkvI family membrane protein [Sphingomonas sp. PAMC 26617]|uniref:YkvI family membrane protein n=1 Tax=Sphingomonas sp. PAMC 26617 TaxID=1112216 RepID=UPI000289EE9B|nr:membrane protein [Sphingomonas sp. PAMC 26617]